MSNALTDSLSSKGRFHHLTQRISRHLLVLLFTGGVFLFFVIETSLPLELAVLGFMIVLASSLIESKPQTDINPALLSSQKNLALRREVADFLPYPTLILNSKGSVRLANKAAKKLFQRESLRDVPFSSIIRDPNILEALELSINDSQHRQVEWQLHTPHTRFFRIDIAPALKVKGNLKPFVLVSFDEQTEIRLAEQMRSDFIANASHELKTPLSIFIGYLETLRTLSPEDKENRQKFIGIMEDQSNRMVSLVEDLLSLNRIEKMAHIPPKEKIDLETVIAEAIDINQSTAQKLNIKINRPSPAHEKAITSGSHSELTQAVSNLINNALTYTNSTAEIEIALEESTLDNQPAWAIHIKDYGKGISPFHIPRLTERFYRINPEKSRQLGGTGLGLAIVKHILTRHRGKLLISSQLGEGSTFSLLLLKDENNPSS